MIFNPTNGGDGRSGRPRFRTIWPPPPRERDPSALPRPPRPKPKPPEQTPEFHTTLGGVKLAGMLVFGGFPDTLSEKIAHAHAVIDSIQASLQHREIADAATGIVLKHLCDAVTDRELIDHDLLHVRVVEPLPEWIERDTFPWNVVPVVGWQFLIPRSMLADVVAGNFTQCLALVRPKDSKCDAS